MSVSALPETTLQSLAKTYDASANMSTEKIRKVSEEFEATFLTTMLNTMMEGVGDDTITGQSFAKDNFKGFLVEEYAKEIVSAGGIGVADQIYREMIRAQEDARGETQVEPVQTEHPPNTFPETEQ